MLAGYFTQIDEFRREVHFQLPDLCNWLKPSWLAWLTFRGHKKRIAEYWDDEELPRSRAKFNGTRDYINNSNRVRLANNLLAERRLITLIPHDSITDLFGVSLTLDGYDLGRRHSNFFDCWPALMLTFCLHPHLANQTIRMKDNPCSFCPKFPAV